jgi:hypothetical protein
MISLVLRKNELISITFDDGCDNILNAILSHSGYLIVVCGPKGLYVYKEYFSDVSDLKLVFIERIAEL